MILRTNPPILPLRRLSKSLFFRALAEFRCAWNPTPANCIRCFTNERMPGGYER